MSHVQGDKSTQRLRPIPVSIKQDNIKIGLKIECLHVNCSGQGSVAGFLEHVN